MQIPKNETLWVTQRDGHGQVLYVITAPPDRSVHKLYVPDGSDGWKMLFKANSPTDLYRRFDALHKTRVSQERRPCP